MASTGTVYQRGSDGRWCAVVRVGQKRVVRYAQSERAARQQLRQLLGQDVAGALAAPSKTTLQQWSEQWLDATQRRPSTLALYRRLLAPVLDEIGSVRLERLTPRALALLFTKMRRQGRGTRPAQQAFIVLCTCLNAAVRHGLLARNPLAGVEKPQHTPERKQVWTLEQTQQFLGACASSRSHYAPLFVFLCGTGLRVSEALGLRWGDVTTDAISIRRALVANAGRNPSIQAPKSGAGNRTVTLTAPAAAALTRLQRGPDEAAVFLTSIGTLPGHHNLLRALKAVCVHAGVPPVGLHQLRHVHASMLLAHGVDLASVSRRLGHSNVAITASVYTHAVHQDRAAASAFDRALTG